MYRRFVLILTCIFLLSWSIKAQISYQISLLNPENGTPLPDHSTAIELTIKDSKGNLIYSERQNAISNEFGILSLNIGDENTFGEANWDNLPFFVSVVTDGRLIGSTQILNVPVAEYAKQSGLTVNHLCKNPWYVDYNWILYFYPDGTFYEERKIETFKGLYYIVDNYVFTWDLDQNHWNQRIFIPQTWTPVVQDNTINKIQNNDSTKNYLYDITNKRLIKNL